MPTVNCPACEEELELDETYRDWTVRCPHCDREFVPSETGRDPRDDEPEEEEYDDNYVYGYEERDRRDALARVHAPAIITEILGWGGVALTLFACFLMLLDGINDMNKGNAGGEVMLVTCGCVGIFGLPYSFLIAWGGRHMRNLTSFGWSLAAAILCIVAFPLLSVCGVLHLGVGIWAMVVINDRRVRRAFNFDRRQRRRTWD
jgi:hypothetical protein